MSRSTFIAFSLNNWVIFESSLKYIESQAIESNIKSLKMRSFCSENFQIIFCHRKILLHDRMKCWKSWMMIINHVAHTDSLKIFFSPLSFFLRMINPRKKQILIFYHDANKSKIPSRLLHREILGKLTSA